jgi:hypothetical protein
MHFSYILRDDITLSYVVAYPDCLIDAHTAASIALLKSLDRLKLVAKS